MLAKNLIEWRELVLKRDNYTCQSCHNQYNGRTDKYGNLLLVAHHIKDKKVYPQYELETDNGIALCTKCHRKQPNQLILFHYIAEKDGYGRSSSPRNGWYCSPRIARLGGREKVGKFPVLIS